MEEETKDKPDVEPMEKDVQIKEEPNDDGATTGGKSKEGYETEFKEEEPVEDSDHAGGQSAKKPSQTAVATEELEDAPDDEEKRAQLATDVEYTTMFLIRQFGEDAVQVVLGHKRAASAEPEVAGSNGGPSPPTSGNEAKPIPSDQIRKPMPTPAPEQHQTPHILATWTITFDEEAATAQIVCEQDPLNEAGYPKSYSRVVCIVCIVQCTFCALLIIHQ